MTSTTEPRNGGDTERLFATTDAVSQQRELAQFHVVRYRLSRPRTVVGSH
jgi:hypothetical protein